MKKSVFIVMAALLALAAGCSGKSRAQPEGVSGGDNAVSGKGGNSGGSASTVKAGTPAPASDFTVKLNNAGDGVEITAYTGSGLVKTLTIPAVIEDLPVLKVSIKDPTLEQVFVPEGVKIVFFYGCTNLRAVSLPDSLEIIESFSGCTKLQSVTIPPNVTRISSSSSTGGAFEGTAIQSITIPASVSGELFGTFKDCKNLVKAEISGSDLKLRMTFRGCDALKTVIINEGVQGISDYTFRGCTSLQNITWPGTLTSIGMHAFYECASLTSIAIPQGVENIGEYAFYNCTNLESVSLPKSVTLIGNNAFAGCNNLITVEIEEGAAIRGLARADLNTNYKPKLSLKSQAAIKAATKY